MAWVMYLVAVASIVAMLAAVDAVLEWSATGRTPRVARPLVRVLDRLHARFGRKPEPIPPVLLALELRRIARELARTEADNQFAKATRVNACRWAYDRVLIDYCRAVDVPVMTDVVPLTPEQRLDLETDLVGAGHGW